MPISNRQFESDHEAIDFLKEHGYVLAQGFIWHKPKVGYTPTPDEAAALNYLFLEWDFGDAIDPPVPPEVT